MADGRSRAEIEVNGWAADSEAQFAFTISSKALGIMKDMRTIPLLLILLSLSVLQAEAQSAHPTTNGSLPSTTKGQLVRQYFETFNGGETTSPKITDVRILPIGDGGPPTAPPPTPQTASKLESERLVLDRIRQLVQDRSKADTFSGAVLVAKGPKIIWSNAYGLADRNFNISNQLNTRFDTGSIAKSFTKVAIGQLVEQGKLHLEDTLGKYVPEYPNQAAREKVTVSELLDMTSGVGDIFGHKLDKTPVGDIRTLSDYLPLFESEPLAFEPGSKHAYSNGGYILLGIIIEKISGRSYYDYVQEHIFRPAGMKATDFPLGDMPHDNEATGYTRMTGNSQPAASMPSSLKTNVLIMPARGCSAGSARTTVQDLFLYTQALARETLLKKSTADKLAISSSALGIGGGGPGINAGIETGIRGAGSDPYTVIVMSNYDPPSAIELMREIPRMLRSAQ